MATRGHVVRTLGACVIVAGGRTVALAQTPVVVKVGAGITEGNAQVFYAIDQGFFKKSGVDVDLTLLRSGGPIMEAIVAGQLQAGSGNSVSLGSAVLRGIPLVVVAPGQIWVAGSPAAAIVVAADSAIKSMKDLAGKTVGVTSLRNVGELAFRTYFDQAGVDASGVKFVEFAPLQVAEAVASGRVAAGTLVDPELSNAIATGKVRRLLGAYDAISKLFYLTVWFAASDWLAKNKELGKRFADGIIQGGMWGEANREQARLVLAKYTKVMGALSTTRFGNHLDPALLQAIWDPAYKYKIYNAPVRAADYCWDGR